MIEEIFDKGTNLNLLYLWLSMILQLFSLEFPLNIVIDNNLN